jgi:deferrochelatase/peroxidase EfeB
MDDLLPRGIYYRPRQTPPDFFRLATFNFVEGTSRRAAHDALAELFQVIGDLRQGVIRDLRPTLPNDPLIKVDPGDLEVVLGFGKRLFRAREGDVLAAPAPFNLPDLGAGPFPRLRWRSTARRESAQTDFALALHGNSELTVARALVELSKAIDDKALPVRLVCFFAGLHRDDRRSWIDFHDGLNNMRSGDERRLAIETLSEQPWLVGGSKMLFLKIEIDLEGWRRLSRQQQEVLVGRNKLTGCPLVAAGIGPDGIETTSAAGCPAVGGEIDRSNPAFIEIPSVPLGDLLQESHVIRSNRHRQGPDNPGNNRIYRQGYEFVDSPPEGGLRVGLNFVSFQSDFKRVLDILRTPAWLGDANFGGIPSHPQVGAFDLMHLVAGGAFVVPPVGDPFPGASIFA